MKKANNHGKISEIKKGTKQEQKSYRIHKKAKAEERRNQNRMTTQGKNVSSCGVLDLLILLAQRPSKWPVSISHSLSDTLLNQTMRYRSRNSPLYDSGGANLATVDNELLASFSFRDNSHQDVDKRGTNC
jgi:hypothetical protein